MDQPLDPAVDAAFKRLEAENHEMRVLLGYPVARLRDGVPATVEEIIEIFASRDYMEDQRSGPRASIKSIDSSH